MIVGKRMAIEQLRLLSLAVQRVCELLIGPWNTRNGANLEVILPATVQAKGIQHEKAVANTTVDRN